MTYEGGEGHADRGKHNHRQQDHNASMTNRDHNATFGGNSVIDNLPFQIHAVYRTSDVH